MGVGSLPLKRHCYLAWKLKFNYFRFCGRRHLEFSTSGWSAQHLQTGVGVCRWNGIAILPGSWDLTTSGLTVAAILSFPHPVEVHNIFNSAIELFLVRSAVAILTFLLPLTIDSIHNRALEFLEPQSVVVATKKVRTRSAICNKKRSEREAERSAYGANLCPWCESDQKSRAWQA